MATRGQPTGRAVPVPVRLGESSAMLGQLARRVALAFVAPHLPFAAWAQSAQDVPVDLELVLAVDISGSVDEVEARLQRDGYISAFRHPEVIEAVQGGMFRRIAVAYVEWAGDHHQQTVLDWTLIEDAASAYGFADALAETPLSTGRWTSISGVTDYAVPLFEDNGFEGFRRVIDISGDGYNNRGRPVESARDDAVAAGLTINGLPIVNERTNPWGGPPAVNLDLYYEERVIGGPGAFIVVAEDYTAFASAVLSKLLLEIAGDAPPDGRALVQSFADSGPAGTTADRPRAAAGRSPP